MSYASIIDIFEERVEASAGHVALRFRRNGRTIAWSWRDWHDEVIRIASYLRQIGVEEGDRVVILSRNRPEWVVADLAIMYVGAVSVPIYPATLARHCRWTVRHAEADWMIVEDPVQLEKVIEITDELEDLKGVVLFDRVAQLERPDRAGRVRVPYSELTVPSALAKRIAWYDDAPDVEDGSDARIRSEVDPDDLASIVYTSGTTGTPRGAMLSHRSFVAEVLGNADVMPITEDDRQILLLPMSQIFARILYMTTIYLGAETSFSSGFSHLLSEFQREKPTFFVGVPSVFERLGANFTVDTTSGRLVGSKRLRRLAMSAIAKSRSLQGRSEIGLVDRLVFEFGDRTVFERLRRVFGGRLRFAISGGAPLSRTVCEVFHGAGIPILEGYGLTESCGAAAVNTPDAFVAGTVGRPLPCVSIRIDESGEILLSGDSLATGYWNDEEATARNFVDGWFRTGDLGGFCDRQGNSLDINEYRDGAYLRIYERIDDTIVLKDGTKVSPQRIESVLQSSPIIRTAVVTTTDELSVSALLTLESRILRRWAHQNGLGQVSFEELCVHPSVYEWVKREVNTAKAALRPVESVRNFAILPVSFSPESGELTHTFKVRRRFVIDKYRSVLERLDSRRQS